MIDDSASLGSEGKRLTHFPDGSLGISPGLNAG